MASSRKEHESDLPCRLCFRFPIKRLPNFMAALMSLGASDADEMQPAVFKELADSRLIV